MNDLIFNEIDLSMADKINRLRGDDVRSSHCFVSLFLWKKDMGLSVCTKNNAFLVKQQARGDNSYFFPCGSTDGKKYLWESLPVGSAFHYSSEEDIGFLEEFYPGTFTTQEAPDDHEYLYDRTELTQMSGSKHFNIRKSVRRAEAEEGWQLAAVTPGDYDDILKAATDWQEQRGNAKQCGDYYAATVALNNFDSLGLFGVTARVGSDRHVMGFVLCSYIRDDIIDVHIIKSLDVRLSDAVFRGCFLNLPEKVQTVNLEEDLGLEGLRTHKNRLRPCGLNKLYTIIKNN